jgi:RNA polymerase sigma-70 factor, ECF subfamily
VDGREQAWATAMRAAKRGDAAAYEHLLADVARMVRLAARRRLSQLGLSTAETEDVVQEVLLALHQKRHTWDEGRPILPWVRAIARYKVVDAVRRLIRQRRLHVDAPVEDWADWLSDEARDPDRTLVAAERALTNLSRREQGVVRAVALEGETIRGTAQRLAMSEGAVRIALHRGLRRLATLAGGIAAVKVTR